MNIISIKKVVRFHLFDSIKNMALLFGCAFLVGFATVMVAMLIFKQDTYIVLGSVFAGMSSVFSIVIVTANSFAVRFPQDVKMNISRASSLVGGGIVSVLAALFGTCILTVFALLEDMLYKSLFSSFAVNVFAWFPSVFSLIGTMLLIHLAFIVGVFILSATLAKFGRSGVLIVYFACLAMLFVVPRMVNGIVNGNLFSIIASMPPFVLPVVITLVVSGFSLWAARTLLTIDIT